MPRSPLRPTGAVLLAAGLLAILPFAGSPARADCAYGAWIAYNGLPLSRLADTAYLFQTAHKAFDADGAPNAYHPDNIGLDNTANAGWPKRTEACDKK